ncbi:cytochrome P450 [Paenibacillus humicola]|uniref:cytochrome P450 n=1 Tax=Paenibacillus humicola TaxID=3110540 RepID=UPI003B834B3E
MQEAKFASLLIMPELDSAEKLLQPFGILSELRRKGPVRYDEARACWVVLAYDEVHRVLKDPKTFSSIRGTAAGQNILFMDPPRHTQMRDLVNKAFTPRAIQELAPRIQSIAEELLDRVDGDEMDMVHDFAAPLPVIVIAELLGAPAEDRDDFKRWSDALVESAEDLTDEAFRALIENRKRTFEELFVYFKSILEVRAAVPRNDLISALLAAEIDGIKLTEQEIISFCILLLAAGNETTTNLITNGVRILTEQPALQDELRRTPEAIPGFNEEVLRYYPPVIAIGRVAAQDTELGTHQIKAGEQVVSMVGAANRDESKFPEPDRFDMHRKPNPHLSFGFGIHFCLGAPLARLEAQIAMQALLRRYSRLERIPDRQLVPIQSAFVFGVKHYPVSINR